MPRKQNKFKKTLSSALVLSALWFSGTVSAQDWYVGLHAGRQSIDANKAIGSYYTFRYPIRHPRQATNKPFA